MVRYWLHQIDQWQSGRLIAFAVFFSLLLAGWMQYIQHGWINPDSVLYFEQAKRYVQGDFAGMVELFNWPLYGMCIGTVHQLTSLSLHLSAQCLNCLFFALATFSFLNLIKLLGGTSRTLFFGAALLFSSQYIVGDVLEMLMRDEGFWAFFLTGLFFFVRFALLQKVSDALLWQVCTIIAMLFRLEAIAYLLLLPLLYLFTVSTPWRERVVDAIQTYSLSLFFAVGVLIYFAQNPEMGMSHFGRLQEVFDSHFYSSLTEKLFVQADIMAKDVLERYLDEFAVEGILITFAFILISKTIVATGYIPTTLAYFGIKAKSNTMTPLGKRILLLLLIIGITTASLIIIKRFVLSKRYLVTLVWVLLIFASFQIAKLSKQNNSKSRFLVIALSVCMVLGLIKNALPKRDGYNYEQAAVSWLNAKNPTQKTVFYHNSRLRFYANANFQAFGNFWDAFTAKIESQQASPYDYLVINISKRDQDKLTWLANNLPNYQEIKRFYAPAQKKYCAVYYRLPKESKP